MKMASLLILIMPMVVLGFTAVASVDGRRHQLDFQSRSPWVQ